MGTFPHGEFLTAQYINLGKGADWPCLGHVTTDIKEIWSCDWPSLGHLLPGWSGLGDYHYGLFSFLCLSVFL